MAEGIFVKIEKHEEIQNIMNSIREKTAQAKDKLSKIRALDAQEHQKMAEFDEAIEHINSNLDHISGFLRQ